MLHLQTNSSTRIAATLWNSECWRPILGEWVKVLIIPSHWSTGGILVAMAPGLSHSELKSHSLETQEGGCATDEDFFSSQMMSDVRSSTEVAITLGCSQATGESSWIIIGMNPLDDQEMLESATKRLERTFRKRDDGSFLEEALRVKRRILGWRCIRCAFIRMNFGSFPWNLQDVFGFWGLFHRIWLELCPMRFSLDLIQVTIYNDWL